MSLARLRVVLFVVLVGAIGVAQETGNVIFLHPDGTGLNHWNAARMYWEGPDGLLEWDQLPEMAIYRGHMASRLTGTSHGGATVHAFGYKVFENSFGKDGLPEGGARFINGLSGFEGSIMREAAAAGYPIGLVNDGDLPEPGTAVFLTEVDDRGNSTEIARQLLDGRPGFEGEPLPAVMLGGGERFFLPEGTPMCEAGNISPECHLHLDAVNGRGPAREDGRNLIQEATDLGFIVVRTRDEFEALMADIDADESYAPSVLGLFASDDIFNDQPEETLITLGLRDPNVDPDSKEGDMILWGGMPDTFTYNPPTVAEMTDMALTILERRSEQAGLPFFLVAEIESTDNLPNNANTMGFLQATQRADDMVGVARAFQADNPDTLIITAADSDGGGPQVFSPAPVDDDGNVTVSGGNPTGILDVLDFGFPLDGRYGRQTAPFIAEPDAFGNTLDFAIGYPGRNDVAGGIVSRAQGLNAEMLRTEFSGQFDSTDVYRLMYATLFGEMLEPSYGQRAPDREASDGE
jgi:alkaline phosphatase